MREIKIPKILLIYFGIQILVAIVTTIVLGESSISTNIGMFIANILTILTIYWVGRVNKELIITKFEDFKNKFNIKEILLVIVTQVLLTISIASFLASFIYTISPNIANELMNDDVLNYSSFYELLLVGLLAGILVPIVEELVFRKVMFSRIARKRGVIAGAIISSLIFGLMHIELAMIGAMMFGISCCILYVKYKNILIPISLHMINNSFVVLMDGIDFFVGSGGQSETTMTSADVTSGFIISGVLFVVSITMFILFLRKNKEYLKRKKEVEVEVLS